MISIYVFAALALAVSAQTVLIPDQVPSGQTYNFDHDHRCRVLAHRSVILKNDDHHLLVIDGGYGKFRLNESAEVQDLNPYTIAFDLSKDFETPNFEPLWQIKKTPKEEPIVIRESMWTDTTQGNVYIQGGQFFEAFNTSTSEYHLNKTEYPGYSIWKLDVMSESKKWEDITASVDGGNIAVRTYGGAGTTVPGTNRSIYIGGTTNGYTARDTPMGVFTPSSQVLEFDAGSRELSVGKYFLEDNSTGYWQGSLDYLPIGCDDQEGFLVSLMSQKWPLGTTGVDESSAATEEGNPVPLDTVWLYDLKTKKWHEQETLWFPDKPPPRTRYCSAVAYDPANKTWDLWVHGGQRLGVNNSAGVQDVWVLSMPSFRWSQLNTTIPDVNNLRSHTCHVVGGQLLIVGGHPPAELLAPNGAPCDTEMVKIMDITTDVPGWVGKFHQDSVYTSPDVVRHGTFGQRTPLTPGGWASPDLERAFACASKATATPSPSPTPKPTSDPSEAVTDIEPKLTDKAIAGIAIGSIAGLTMIVLLALCCWDIRRPHPYMKRVSRVLSVSRPPVPRPPSLLVGDKLTGEESSGLASPAVVGTNPNLPVPAGQQLGIEEEPARSISATRTPSAHPSSVARSEHIAELGVDDTR